MAGVDASTWLGVYDHPPPAGTGIVAVELDQDSLFASDAAMVRGAMEATAYRDRLRDWIGSHLP